MVTLPDQFSAKPVGRHPLPREVMAEHQRERILDVAAEVFAKRGYLATTVDNIVAAAKIGVGGFYQHFSGKEDCFLHAFERILAAERAHVAEAVPRGLSWPERIAAALAAILDSIAAAPLRARVVLVEAPTAGPASLARYEAVLDEAAALLRGGRELDTAPDRLPPQVEEAIVAGVVWLLQQRLVMGEPLDRAQLLPELIEIVVGPFAGAEQTQRLIARL